jgi:hypothetical protein
LHGRVGHIALEFGLVKHDEELLPAQSRMACCRAGIEPAGLEIA